MFFCFQIASIGQQKQAVSITFKAPSFKTNMYYLAGYYGKYTVLLDSTKANLKGEINFKKNKKYTEGIYMLVNADKQIVTEFIIDKQQQFSISLNLEHPDKTTIENSETNTLFFEFNTLLKQNNLQIQELTKQLAAATTNKDSADIKGKISTLNKSIIAYKSNIIQKDPDNVLSLLFNLSKPIEHYFNEVTLATKQDSITYLKDHFFEGINFNDERLLRNPFLETKITTYFNVLVPRTADAITKEIFTILNNTGDKNNSMFSYLSIFFANTYANPKVMGNDRVFVNIYNNYFKDKTYSWLTEQQKIFLNTTNAHLKDNLIGNKAKNLFMTSIDGQTLNLHDVNAPYIVVIFWDPSCGHCVKELPKINQWYLKDLKNKGTKIYAVNLNPDLKKEWVDFIEKEHLNDWIHVSPTKVVYGDYSKEEVDFQTLYNVVQTPVIYLLDSTKTFRAKNISVENYIHIINQLQP
ncbi:DUF5106 domain-containing protein [Lutibacter sp. A80]|uniref:redoxin domain-containing protein n=1 Tax=Lutibacter sp. A80 TaxID=2918453 RepID=UPI001F060A78|nr:redoxin domain-containing protein [Lutibacter sp. A80]UMB59109.1 DUF5106 domain-containing protein [Lutibacter sp. A80]